MKRIMTSLSTLPLLAATILFIAPSSVLATTAGDSTNGHGSFNTTATYFVFDAKVKGDGTITGRARFFDNSSLSIDIDVDCLSITGDVAIIGGTDHNNSSTTYAFKVTDNGGGATADRITLPQVGQTCATFNTLTSFALTSGDLEVRDQP